MREPLSDHPHLMKQWDNEKNHVDPYSLSAGSGRKVWWVCDEGHSYDMAVFHRTSGSGCRYCSGNETLPGQGDLISSHPILVENYWDNSRNDIDPSCVSQGSSRQVWWRCTEGHSWENRVRDQVNRKNPCKECHRKNSLRSITQYYPELLHKWDFDRNVDVSPEETGIGSNTKVWWKCEEGHTWERSVKWFSRNSDCPYCKDSLLWKGFNDLETKRPDLVKFFNTDMNDVKPGDVKYNSSLPVWWTCSHGHSWKAPVERINSRNGWCPVCAHHGPSTGEKELSDFVSSLAGEENTVLNSRRIISPYELDIYIPGKNIAIEYNGIYWHSEKYVEDSYHYMKWSMCKDKGIQLITIWEDDWHERTEIVKGMIAHKLGVSSRSRVYARSTETVMMEWKESRDFLDSHHIQGATSGSCYIGLKKNNQVVASSVWRKNKDVLYLDRYATSVTVIGGMGKLLKAGIRHAREHECSQIVTFADHCVSDGGLYEKLGFRLDEELAPDYRYVVGGERVHKFNYRLKRFRDDPELEYVEGMSERELARLNNIPRIWDCGKSRYVYDIS